MESLSKINNVKSFLLNSIRPDLANSMRIQLGSGSLQPNFGDSILPGILVTDWSVSHSSATPLGATTVWSSGYKGVQWWKQKQQGIHKKIIKTDAWQNSLLTKLLEKGKSIPYISDATCITVLCLLSWMYRISGWMDNQVFSRYNYPWLSNMPDTYPVSVKKCNRVFITDARKFPLPDNVNIQYRQFINGNRKWLDGKC